MMVFDSSAIGDPVTRRKANKADSGRFVDILTFIAYNPRPVRAKRRRSQILKLFNNPLVLSAMLAMAVAQVTKVILILLTERRWAPERMMETGGMPSS
ncbi:MAG: divergent PAP2 family protein, partial [Spirochaetaceae bacterium]|nr:divergent PAP2 family protein [Spirochaetaceae bacterium]